VWIVELWEQREQAPGRHAERLCRASVGVGSADETHRRSASAIGWGCRLVQCPLETGEPSNHSVGAVDSSKTTPGTGHQGSTVSEHDLAAATPAVLDEDL
jgi:hypothetical protein